MRDEQGGEVIEELCGEVRGEVGGEVKTRWVVR